MCVWSVLLWISKKRICYYYSNRQKGWCKYSANLERGRKLRYSKHENSSGINSNPPLADRGWLNIHDSLHSVCVQGCRLSDVWPCGLGSVWAGVSTFTFAPRDLYWGDRKHTSVKLSRVILYQVLPGWSVYRREWRGKDNKTALRIIKGGVPVPLHPTTLGTAAWPW